MSTTKIKWTDHTFNPVWGCFQGCKYCYARVIAKRFGKIIAIKNNVDTESVVKFKPTWLENHFQSPLPSKPSRIFVGSMSDIFFWKDQWIENLIKKMEQHPQHTFQLLTKTPKIYLKYKFPKNVMKGITITNQNDLFRHYDTIMKVPGLVFLSMEPVTGHFNLDEISKIDDIFFKINLIIVGAMSGNNEKTDHAHFNQAVNVAKHYGITLFVKQVYDQLKNKLVTDINEFPEEYRFQNFPNDY